MKYLLDTNICINLFRGKFNLIDKFQDIPIKSCAISEITLAELILGLRIVLNRKAIMN
jgi:tRNA(fMet)-specific endonuclease VapC